MLTNVEHKRFDDDDDCDNKYVRVHDAIEGETETSEWTQTRCLSSSESMSGLVLLQSASSLQPVDIAGDTKMLESGTKTRALLRFNVRRARLLFVTTIAGIIMTLVILLCAGAGINLGVVSRDRGSAGHKSLIDTYNSVSGVLVSATLAPIEMVLSMLAAVASLTFSSDFAVKRGLHSHLMIAALGAAMSFLVTNGLSALNVQLIPGDVVAMITSADLELTENIDNQPAPAANGSLLTTWDTSFAENRVGNPSFNTIFRSHFMDMDERYAYACPNDDYMRKLRFKNPPLAWFGFRSRTWHQDTLSTALDPQGSITFKLTATDLPLNKELPMSIANASFLVLAAAHVVPYVLSTNRTEQYEKWGGGIDSNPLFWRTRKAYSETNSSGGYSAAEFAGVSKSDFIGSSTQFLRKMLNNSNYSVSDIGVAYSHFDLGDSVVFNALTLDIPTTTTDIEVPDLYCASDGCVLDSIGNGKQPYVYAIGICANEDGSEDFRMNFSRANLRTRVFSDCNHRSNTSMLLVGVGKKVVGDSWDYDESSGSVKLGGVKSVYSITFGLLSWTVESLDKVFGATCVSNSNCRGVWYPLDPVHPESSDVLVIHEAKLPLDGLDYVALDYVWDEYGASTTSIGEKDWKRLLMLVGTETDSYDLLLPRRFLNVTPNAWAAQRNSEDCRWYWDTRKFIWVVEQNHLYAEESLQMTYTAGVFYLFGSAVRQKQLTNSSTLAFTGNTQPLRIQASIPRVNVIISLTGVVVTLAAAIGIAILHKRTSRKIERTADVEVVAEAMFNRAKYPPTFLSLSLHDIFDRAFPAEQEAFLQDLRVQHIELVSIAAEASSRTSTFTVNSSLA